MSDSDLFNGGNEIGRDVPTHYHALEGNVLSRLWVRFHRLDVPDNFGVLTRASSLLLMRIGEIRALSDSLTECYSRFSSDAIGVILSAHAFNIDLQVKFSHAGNNGLDKGRSLAGH